MRTVTLDKVASVTLNCGLRREVKVSDDFPCQAGDVVAVRVLTNKSHYNTLELTTGRMSGLKQGDVIAGALGHRRALMGYAGEVPGQLAVGDRINLLNLGGVLGVCTSVSPTVGAPFECEVLGQVLEFPYLASRVGVPANIARGKERLTSGLDLRGVPVVAVCGTCMNSGKTEACLALIQQFARRGMRVSAAKATGVSLRRDVLAMEDAGAGRTMVFTDLGTVTTSRADAADLARTMLHTLAEDRPDVIVLELGDGLMGDYGVDAVLLDPEVKAGLSSVVLAAGDPVGAWGGTEILRAQFSLRPTVVTGPATDNTAGTDLIRDRLGLPGVNARSNGEKLAETVLGAVGASHV